MGISIEGSCSTSATQSTDTVNPKQRQQAFKDLFSALKSGDLEAAQKAYAALGNGSNAANGKSLLGQIGQALQSGDLAGAQQAAQTLQAHRSGHHHHDQEGGDTATAAPATTPATSATSGPGTLINLMA